ncbi:oleate-activated transcription factor 1 [Fusarium pseudocircinatum]|uniref:Oleate-activated transcription factor 1 n=1 Tax=Fusarium pseudocircinatum TaxID=56676 RepID=A0A8H5KYR8_9HYPO|nr:oleate-activated transcription factor 1 [Fusarium pseudocircinatum]
MTFQPRRRADSHRASISRPSSTYARKRAIKACQVCRARRTKCDQQRPACSFCVKAGVECVFEPDTNVTFDQASLAIIDRLDRLERKIDSQSKTLPAFLRTPYDDSIPETSDDLPPEVSVIHKTLFPITIDKLLQWNVFRDVQLPTLTSHTQQSPVSRSECSNVQRPWADEITDRASCERWLSSFFAHIHVKNPILDEEETRRLVSRLCAQGLDWSIESGLALLVCANGAIARPLGECLPMSHPDRQMAISLFDAAQKRLGGGLGPAGLIHAQCAFLSGVLLMSLIRPVEAWTTFVHGLAICQTLPYIRQLDHASGQTSTQETSEQSVLWSCWKSEQELRFELGMSSPTGLADDPPELFPKPPDGCEGDVERAWYFYLSEIALWRVEVNARRLMGQLQHGSWLSLSRALREIGKDTSHQLETWQASLPPLVSIENGSSPYGGAENDVIRFVLRGRITYIRELISWPFMHATLNEAAEQDVDDHDTSAALAYHHERLLVNAPGYYHRHHGTWLMLRSSARSACILLGFAHLHPGSILLPLGWKDAVLTTLKMVEYWSLEADGMLSVLQTMKWFVQVV